MDTLIAGHRTQTDGPVSEAVIVQQNDTGEVYIDLATFDEKHSERPEGARDALIARSLITIPPAMMDQLADAWKQKHPDGYTEEGWTPLSADATPELVASSFVKEMTSP